MFEESVSSVPSIWASMNSWFTPTVLFVLLNVMIGTIAYTSTLANQKQQQQQQKTQEDSHQQQQQAGRDRSTSVLQRLKSIEFPIYRSKEPRSSVPSIADSDTHYPPQQTQQQQTLETETQYVSRQTHQQQALEREAQYVSRLTHLQQTLERERETHLQQTLERETQFVSQHTHQQQTLETETTQYVPEQRTRGGDIGDDQQTIEEIYSQHTDHHVTRTMSDIKPASGEVPVKLPAKIQKSATVKSAFGHFSEEEIVEPRRPATEREAKVTEADEEVDSKADASGDVPAKLPAKIKKSASMKLAFGHFSEEEIVEQPRRPATVRETRVTEADEEVDSKADDFINKFRRDLKLQRLDSIKLYKDMIGRGSEK